MSSRSMEPTRNARSAGPGLPWWAAFVRAVMGSPICAVAALLPLPMAVLVVGAVWPSPAAMVIGGIGVLAVALLMLAVLAGLRG